MPVPHSWAFRTVPRPFSDIASHIEQTIVIRLIFSDQECSVKWAITIKRTLEPPSTANFVINAWLAIVALRLNRVTLRGQRRMTASVGGILPLVGSWQP